MPPKREPCRNFQRGSCHYGDRCKFLHVIQQPSKANSFGFGLQNGTQFHRANSHSQTPNPFGLGVQNSSQPRAANNFGSQFKHFENKWTRGSSKETGNSAPSQQTDNQPPAPTHKCTDPESCKRQIIEDLENEKPLWTLTCYGHCKNGPCDITGDISYEELRAVAYDDAKRGLSLQSIVERERSLLNSKLLEFENLRRDPYILPNSTISMQSSFPGTRPPVLAQNVSPPSVSSFSQLGASLDTSSITRTTAPGNNAFGQPSPFQNSASVDSKHPIQSFGSSFGSSIASFGNNSIKVEGNPLFASAVSQPKLSGFSLVGQTTAGFHSMHNSQSQNGTEENSIWSKEEWYPGEVPEEAPPGVDSY